MVVMPEAAITIEGMSVAEWRIVETLAAIDAKLGRLVTLEEERREGERGMEALAQSLLPSGGMSARDLDALDWFNGRDGRYWVRDAAGDRPATADESVAIAASIKGRRG